jgi:hypothetical protein
LIEPAVNVTIHIKDAQTKQTMVASWQFNYDAPASTTTAPAIGSGGASVNSNKPAR